MDQYQLYPSMPYWDYLGVEHVWTLINPSYLGIRCPTKEAEQSDPFDTRWEKGNTWEGFRGVTPATGGLPGGMDGIWWNQGFGWFRLHFLHVLVVLIYSHELKISWFYVKPGWIGLLGFGVQPWPLLQCGSAAGLQKDALKRCHSNCGRHCRYGPGGNAACWDGPYTFEVCCQGHLEGGPVETCWNTQVKSMEIPAFGGLHEIHPTPKNNVPIGLRL